MFVKMNFSMGMNFCTMDVFLKLSQKDRLQQAICFDHDETRFINNTHVQIN